MFRSLSFSKITLFFCCLLLAFSGSIFYPRWNKYGCEAQISWDAGGYYWYLPSTFIYHDLKGQSFKDSILQTYSPTPPNEFQYAFKPSEKSNYVLKYSMGLALLESPYFFIAHILAKPLGYPADGFSRPYQVMIYLGGLFFAIVGLWYLRKLLLFYFSDTVVAITLFLLVVGTNYLNYAGIDVGMTHTWLFTLYVLLLLNTHYFYEAQKFKYALRIGVVIGLLALVRPPEIIAVIIPLMWGMNAISLKLIKDRIAFFKKTRKALLAAGFIALVLISFQFIYWKIVSGNWFVYTYQNQGFSWLQPNLKKYALNYECGWLMFTPVMFFAVIGLILYFKKGSNKVAIITLALVNYYIVAAWDAWNYGGRAMIQDYPVLLFALAVFIQFVLEQNWRKWLFTPILLLFAYFNIWWTYQSHGGSLMGDAPGSKAYYWKTILRYNLPLEVQKLRDNEDIYWNKIKSADTLYKADKNYNLTVVNDMADSITIHKPSKKYKWIRASANFHIQQKEWNIWFMTQFMIRFKKGNTITQENSIRIQRLMGDNGLKNIYIDAKIRSEDFDHIEIIFRNDNKGTLPCNINNPLIIGFNN